MNPGPQNSRNPICDGSICAHINGGDQSEPDLSDSAINSLAAPFFAVLQPCVDVREPLIANMSGRGGAAWRGGGGSRSARGLGAVSKKWEAFDTLRGYVEGIDMFLERVEMAGGNRHVSRRCRWWRHVRRARRIPARKPCARYGQSRRAR
jgi:hypothetical protein